VPEILCSNTFHLEDEDLIPSLGETQAVKSEILTRSQQDLGMNKSTLWYQKKRLEETGTVRLYNKTKRYFV
jgi:hypothetical protein